MTIELKQRRNIIVLFEDCEIDWCWDEDDLMELINMNKNGASIREMCERFDRDDPDEVFLALFYLAKRGKITKLDMEQLVKGLLRIVNYPHKKYNKLVLSEREYYRFKDENMTDREIAQKLNVSFETLKSWKYKKGISVRRYRKYGKS